MLMDWSCDNSFGSVDGFSDGFVFCGTGNHRWRLVGRALLVFVILLIMCVVGLFDERAYAENTSAGAAKNNECYHITYTVGNKTGQTNSICFGTTRHALNGNDVTYMTSSEGAMKPIILPDGNAIRLELVGMNPGPDDIDYNELFPNDEIPSMRQVVAPNSENGGASPENHITPFVALMVSYDGKRWEEISYSELTNLSDSGSREDTFEKFASDIQNALDARDFSGIKPENVKIDETTVVVTEPEERSDEEQPDTYVYKKSCEETKGSEALGWLVCPIITWMGKAAEQVYDKYIQPSLELSPELFSGGSESVKQAWGMFRDAANIAFVILLVFVVMSQITGVGITNYGIKKILPKMILVMVLINLSYILCVMLVDFSNILGNGFQALFERMSGDGPVTINAFEDSAFIVKTEEEPTWTIESILAGVGVFAGIIALVGAIWKNPSILISLLLVGLGIVIAIFFLFMLLAVRKASIMVLTAISPLAMACYMLPNTKKLFDRWLDFFKALLLVYPIAGLLVGAGDFVSRMILPGSSDFFTWITAMVISVVPIFLIPLVLKNAFSAMGKIGGMLTSLGDKTRRKTTGAIRNTDRYQRLMKAGQERRDMKNLKKASGAYIGKDGLLHERKSLRGKLASSRLGSFLGADVAMGRKRGEFTDAQIARMTAAGNMDANNAIASMQDLKTDLANQSLRADIAADIGPKPVINKEKLRVLTQNDINQMKADNAVKAIALDPRVLEEKMKTQQSMQLQKMYADNFAHEGDTEKVKNAFVDSLNGDSGESTVAAMKELLNRGGTAQVFKALENANWAGMNQNVKNQLAQAMGSSGVDALKSYSKYLSTGGSAGFREWSTGDISEKQIREEAADGVKDGTYIQHLMEGGANAMVNFDKDQMEFVAGKADDIIKNMGAGGADKFGSMVKNVAVKSNNAMAQTVAENTIRDEISSGGLNISNLNLVGSDLGSMRGELATAMRDGMAERYKRDTPTMSDEIARMNGTNAVQIDLREQIAIAKADPATLRNMNSTTGSVLNLKVK